MANDSIEMRSSSWRSEAESGEGYMEVEELEAAIRSFPYIFQLPESVRNANPDAFLPRLIAFGPHNTTNKMELYKLCMANKAQQELHLPEFHQLHAQLRPLHPKILVCYDTYLKINSHRLTKVMLVDALFLLRLFRNISDQMQTSRILTLPLPNFDDLNLVNNMMLNDLLKLENQIPVLVFETILSNSPNPNSLLVFLFHFSESVSPFAFSYLSSRAILSLIHPTSPSCYDYKWEISIYSEILNQSHHLLHFTYLAILISPMHFIDIAQFQCSAKPLPIALTFFQKWLSILGYVLDIDFIQQLNEALGFIQELFELLGILKKQTATPIPISSPVIPSASQLHKLFKFQPDENGILYTKFIKYPGIEYQIVPSSTWNNIFKRVPEFSSRTVKVKLPPTLKLPVITINAFTETLLENLLAFEAMANINPPVFARYIELMKALIRTPKDLNILKNAEIIQTTHDLENNDEVVKLFNRVGNSIFNLKTKPANEELNHLHQTYKWSKSETESESKKEIFELINKNYDMGLKGMVEEINQCYDSFWIVKAKKYVRKCLRCVVKMVTILGIVFQMFLVAKNLVSIIIGSDNEPSYQIAAT